MDQTAAASPPSKRESERTSASCFLPDFCANRIIFVMVLLAELFALVLALWEIDRPGEFWNRLAIVSLFVQWVTLGSAAALCLAKRRFN
ncbi:MAG: hypothetical protein JNJ76_03340, partial [Candidatus Competibacter sp.]|nr:hypothetical protein [Candidatus Competibacter sp.]